MKIKIITTLSGYAVLTDDKNSLFPLADYIDTFSEGRIEAAQEQWDKQSQIGTIACLCTPEQRPELTRLLADFMTG